MVTDDASLPTVPTVGHAAVSAHLTEHSEPEELTGGSSYEQAVPLVAGYSTPVNHQVRIERRVIIRIAPTAPSTRQQMLAQLPRREMPTRFEEKKLKGCIDIKDIAGTQPAHPNRLLLFMRDRRVLSVALEDRCKARDFYSGFYVERNKDGKLCSGRDSLQSRAGSSCEVERLSRLVAWQQ
ncbi:hypothetical protein [Altericroceibacterium spongiae]|nr:hypothetical protein [Altericroceibacterium spongiae]